MSKKNNLKTADTGREILGVNSAMDELKKISIILASIIGIVCIFYMITIVVTKNNNSLKYSVTDEISQISYTDILASDILRKDGSYYVLVKDNKDAYVELYDMYLSSYVSSENSLAVYYVDLNDAFNQDYRGSETDLSSSKLQFKDTTLLKIVDGKIESSYKNSETISEHLKSLVINE